MLGQSCEAVPSINIVSRRNRISKTRPQSRLWGHEVAGYWPNAQCGSLSFTHQSHSYLNTKGYCQCYKYREELSVISGGEEYKTPVELINKEKFVIEYFLECNFLSDPSKGPLISQRCSCTRFDRPCPAKNYYFTTQWVIVKWVCSLLSKLILGRVNRYWPCTIIELMIEHTSTMCSFCQLQQRIDDE